MKKYVLLLFYVSFITPMASAMEVQGDLTDLSNVYTEGLPETTRKMVKRYITEGTRDAILSAIPFLEIFTDLKDVDDMIKDFCAIEDKQGRTFIQNLVRYDFVKNVRDVFDFCDSINELDADLLKWAHSEEMVKLLIKHGARYKKDEHGMYLCQYSRDMQMVHAEFQLMQAYEDGDEDSALIALKHGAGPENPMEWVEEVMAVRTMKSGTKKMGKPPISEWVATTLFRRACKENNFAYAKLALEYGADTNCKIDGDHALIWLSKKKFYRIAEYIVASDLKIRFGQKDIISLKRLKDPRGKELLSFLY